MYYHAECLGRSEEQLLKDKQENKPFFCNWAQPFNIFTKKWAEREEDVHFEKLEQKFQESLEEARQKNSQKIPKRNAKLQLWYNKKNNVNNSVPVNGLPATQPPDVYLSSQPALNQKFSAESPFSIYINYSNHDYSATNESSNSATQFRNVYFCAHNSY